MGRLELQMSDMGKKQNPRGQDDINKWFVVSTNWKDIYFTRTR